MNLYTFACLVLFVILYGEVAGDIKLVPNSLPLTIEKSGFGISKESVQLRGYDEDDGLLYIELSDGFRSAAVFRFVTPEGKKIDHFECPIELKFGEKEISFNGTFKEIDDVQSKKEIKNKDIKEGRDIVLDIGANYNKDKDLTDGDKGTVTVNLHGVNENGEVVALWGVTADTEAIKIF